jgi:anti-sigma-K factor RskA
LVFDRLSKVDLMVHDEYKEMLSAHALAALDRQDELALKQHLSECTACRDELDHWNQTTAALTFAAEPAEPSPQVRAQILERIRAEARGRQPQPRETKVSPTDQQTAAETKILHFDRAPRNVWRSIGSLGAIAAVVVFAALLVSLIVLWQQNRAMKNELARLTTEMKTAHDELAVERAARELVSTPGARMAQLAGTKMAPGAHAMLAYDKMGHAMLMAKGLPVAPSGKAYQLWFIVGNKPMPGKVFTTDSAGNGTMQDQMPEVARDSAVFAITLEPAGGMPSPTGEIYLRSGS